MKRIILSTFLLVSALTLCNAAEFHSYAEDSILTTSPDSTVSSQTDTTGKATKKKKKKKEVYYDENGNIIKKGWTFGALPSIAYDADRGFEYGVLGNIYDYGDGSTYPSYLHSIYMEASYTTKRSGIFRVSYDAPDLGDGLKITADISYIPETMNDFIGFNGYNSVYNESWIKCKNQIPVDTNNYISRVFYKNNMDLFRTAFDVEKPIVGNLNWHAGIGVLGYMTGNVNIALLNKGKPDAKKIPDAENGGMELFQLYKRWGLIEDNVASGGWHPYIRGGLAFDSRNTVSNPSKGILADTYLTYTAAFGNQKGYNNLKINATFCHYVTVVKRYLNFAYRIGIQNTIAGESPFYMNNYMNNLTYNRVTYEALGGSNSLRGVIRNRILCKGFAFASVEFRARLWDFKLWKQQFYIGLNAFIDCGIVTQPYKFDREQLTAAVNADEWVQQKNAELALKGQEPLTANSFFDFNANPYVPHLSGGVGFKGALNENFVLSVEWAAPFDRRDNPNFDSVYIKMGYLF